MSLFAAIGICRLAHQEWSDHKGVHSRSQEAVDSLGRRIYDRFVFIEGSVDEDRNPSDLSEPLQQAPIQRVHVALHRLQTAGAVLVCNSRNAIPLRWFN